MRNGRGCKRDGFILDRIRESWEASLEIAFEAGLKESAIMLDPGVGFGTTRREDLEILRGLDLLRSFGFPVLLGASRKRITAQPSGLPVGLRLEPTIVTTVAGVAAGVEVFRVHDVAANARAAGLADLIYRGGELDE
jgi:dihydropteroate synthase